MRRCAHLPTLLAGDVEAVRILRSSSRTHALPSNLAHSSASRNHRIRRNGGIGGGNTGSTVLAEVLVSDAKRP